MNNNTTQQQHNSNTAQHNTTQQQERSQETKLREGINLEREEHSIKPQQRDHSIRLCWHKIFNSSNVFSLSSKDQRFRSNHTIHIKYPGTKSQISELCFPSHWCQLDNKPTTEPGITQWIPKAWSMKAHREWVTDNEEEGGLLTPHHSNTYNTN